MKVQLTASELREVLRQLRLCRDGKALFGEVELNVLVPESKAREVQPEALPPEEQIRRNPALAFDTPEPPPSHDEKVTELLRWFHRPEDAGGLSVYVPHGHPSGLGGQNIYIPKRAARTPSMKPPLVQFRKVQPDLTVTLGAKQWNVSHVPRIAVGQTLWLEGDPAEGVVVRRVDAAGVETAYTLTEHNAG